ncbi:MAG TPA: GatB/YqeY domain-containing protein [Candidatus Paceibacterota bacterium]
MSLQLDLKDEMKSAMRTKNAVRLSVIRGIMSACTNEAIAKGKGPQGELADDETLVVIRREAKKRKDSIEQYTSGGRPELAESEAAELAVIESFLPTQMSADEVRPIVEAKIKELGVTDKSALRQAQGKVIGVIMKEFGAKADGGIVKQVVDSFL